MATEKTGFLDGFRKLFIEQWQADVRIKSRDSDGSAPISAHKLVLAARSNVLKKILEPDECKDSANLETVTLSEMKQEEVEALIEFMYSPDGSISSENLKKHVRSLYLAADKYEIPHLRNICRDQLVSSLNSSNALNILELAQIPFDNILSTAAFATIRTNIREIVSSAEFELFVANYPNLAVEIMKDSLTQTSRLKKMCFLWYLLQGLLLEEQFLL